MSRVDLFDFHNISDVAEEDIYMDTEVQYVFIFLCIYDSQRGCGIYYLLLKTLRLAPLWVSLAVISCFNGVERGSQICRISEMACIVGTATISNSPMFLIRILRLFRFDR